MLLKDADALDRARLSPPGMLDGCDPSRLRLTVLKENTPILDACLTMSLLLTALLTLYDARKSIFHNVTLDFVGTLLSASTGQSESLQQAVHLITDRFPVSLIRGYGLFSISSTRRVSSKRSDLTKT